MYDAGWPDVRLIVAPTLCACEDEIGRAIDVLDEAIGSVFNCLTRARFLERGC